MLDAICGRASECACDSFAAQHSSETQCRANQTERFDRVITASQECGYSYDAQCAGRWVEALNDLGCGQYDELDGPDGLRELVGCKIYTITPSEDYGCNPYPNLLGDACPSDEFYQFASGGDQPQSTCLPFSRGSAGDACMGGSQIDPCKPGLTCIDSTCVAKPGEGEACDHWTLCAEGLVCDQHSQLCLHGLPEGASCGATSPSCALDHFCHEDGSCRALPQLGENCHIDEFGPRCAEGFECAADLSCWNNRPTICNVMEEN
jgi:hypothetical protein